jgi:hypothetical protein
MYSPSTMPVLALAAAFACGACTQAGAAVSPEAGSPESSPGDAAGMTFWAGACAACLQQACFPSILGCTDEPECVAYLDCLAVCPGTENGNVDPSCAAQCPTGTSSAAIQDENAFNACRTSGPGQLCAACGGLDAGSVYGILHESCPPAHSGIGCSDFIDENCCVPKDRCFADPKCGAIVQCAGNCPTNDILPDAGADSGFYPSCIEACVAEHPDALPLFAPLDFCLGALASTAPACGGAPDPCSNCVNATCPELFLEVDEAPGGLGLYNCIVTCGRSLACIGACEAQFPDAVTALNRALTCLAGSCGPMCGPNFGGV